MDSMEIHSDLIRDYSKLLDSVKLYDYLMVEGDKGSGKTWLVDQLLTSPKFGQCDIKYKTWNSIESYEGGFKKYFNIHPSLASLFVVDFLLQAKQHGLFNRFRVIEDRSWLSAYCYSIRSDEALHWFASAVSELNGCIVLCRPSSPELLKYVQEYKMLERNEDQSQYVSYVNEIEEIALRLDIPCINFLTHPVIGT